MIRIAFITILAFLFSCKTVKNNPQNEALKPCERCLAVVEITEDCGVLLKVTQSDNSEKHISPQNLDSKFHKDGLRLKISYAVSTQNPDKKCGKYSLIELTEAYAIR
ncbi:hypothetical protein D3C87_18810 [compost metagenome]